MQRVQQRERDLEAELADERMSRTELDREATELRHKIDDMLRECTVPFALYL